MILPRVGKVQLPSMKTYLTKQEQWVLAAVLSLLLLGWAVKAYRTAHPSTQSRNAAL